MSTTASALAAYRNLLRSARIAFQGDLYRLTAARSAARDGFEANRTLAPGTKEHKDSVDHAEAVAKILRENIVQGIPNPEQEGSYKLRIHEHTERGDNESVKMAGKRNTLTGTKCCSA